MSELSHKEAYRLIHQRQLDAEDRAALRAHLSQCESCRQHAALDGMLSRYLVLSPAGYRPSSAQSAVYMARVKRQNRSQKIIKPVYALASLAAIVILGLAGWFIMRPNLETTSIAASESLVEAVEANDVAHVKRLLEAGADPNAVDSAGDPALKTAVGAVGTIGNTEIIALLLESGADVNAQDSAGNALLPQAARDGQLQVVQLLLDFGADVDGLMSTTKGKGTNVTGLALAANSNHNEIAELLIAHGANVNHAESSMGITVLIGAALTKNSEIITILLENGADPNLQCCPGFGGGPLHAAFEEGSVEAVEALLDGGADVDIRDEFGETPLMSAIIKGPSTSLAKTIDVLLDGGADPNIQDVNGNSALHHAAKLEGKADAVPILLKNGASVVLQNNNGETAVDLATDDAIIELLREARVGE